MKEFIQFWILAQIKESFESGRVLVKEQMEWFARLRSRRWVCAVAYNLDEFKAIVLPIVSLTLPLAWTASRQLELGRGIC